MRPGVDAHVPFKAVLLIALGERELAYAYVNSPRRHPLAAWRWLQFSHVCHTAM